MRPSLLTSNDIEAYLAEGHWARDTMVDRYRTYARTYPCRIACRDESGSYSWAELDSITDLLAANLVGLSLPRDSTALVQIPSSCREAAIRIAFKKAGIIGAFAPLQWRRKELEYVAAQISPVLIAFSRETLTPEVAAWADSIRGPKHRLDLSNGGAENWIDWNHLLESSAPADIAQRAFAFDEVSLITVSSGTSGIAKLCEWPEAAQICMGRAKAERMGIREDDTIGIFAPMSGAAGLLVWTVSGTMPCTFCFPVGFHAATLLDLVEEWCVTVATTVPVILARLAQEPLDARDLRAFRLLRVGTAAADIDAARSFEDRSGCKVVTASGAMECPGFGHADPDESPDARLDGSVGLPLTGCRLRIVDEKDINLPAGEVGELKVSAPFASSGYWNDPDGTAAVWSDGWYATGDMGRLDKNGRLTLLGRKKETINRSGHKILPVEIETEIARHPDVFAVAVAGAPDREYGAAAWAFVQMRSGCTFDPGALADGLRGSGLASYKIPSRFIEVAELPRINDNKVDKRALLEMARSEPAG